MNLATERARLQIVKGTQIESILAACQRAGYPAQLLVHDDAAMPGGIADVDRRGANDVTWYWCEALVLVFLGKSILDLRQFNP